MTSEKTRENRIEKSELIRTEKEFPRNILPPTVIPVSKPLSTPSTLVNSLNFHLIGEVSRNVLPEQKNMFKYKLRKRIDRHGKIVIDKILYDEEDFQLERLKNWRKDLFPPIPVSRPHEFQTGTPDLRAIINNSSFNRKAYLNHSMRRNSQISKRFTLSRTLTMTKTSVSLLKP